MANRTRNESLIIRMTKEEKEIFLEKMKATKSKSYIELLMKCICTHSTVKIDTSPILDMVYEINKIGVNLNQLTKAVNTAKDLNDNNAEKLREEIAKTKTNTTNRHNINHSLKQPNIDISTIYVYSTCKDEATSFAGAFLIVRFWAQKNPQPGWLRISADRTFLFSLFLPF